MTSKPQKEAVEEKPSLLTPEFFLSLAFCGAHAYSLYQGYSSILVTPNVEVSRALHSPLLHWSELSLGTQIPSFPVTGPLFYLTGVYLLTWFVKGTGLTFSMRGTMMAYNLYSTLLSGVMFTLFATRFVTRCVEEKALVWVFHAGDKDFALWVGALYLNMHSKYIEYLDTFIMCLRGKFQQVTDLHVIHHAEMGPIMYLVTVLGEGGGAIATGPMINSFVHFVMYGYYFDTGLGNTRLKSVAKYITSLQMLQFVVLLLQALFQAGMHFAGKPLLDVRCIVIQGFLMLQMLWMFSGFFLEKYGKKKQEGEGKEKKAQ